MSEKVLIGSHVSMSGPDFYLGSVKEALSYGATTFMFYTGAPQNSFRKPLNELKIQEGRKLIKEAGIDESKIIVHAPYLINAANASNPDTLALAKDILLKEIIRTAGFGCKTLVLHPGAHVGAGEDLGISTLIESLNEVLSKDNTDVKIAIETMSGKGSEIGINFEQISKIIKGCKYPERLGVCLDTCHINDAGFEVADIDNVLSQFDTIIGLDKLLVIHLNDSKNPVNAHKDRHENIGYGCIGFDALIKYVNDPRLVNVPKILETPYINEKPPYKEEISMILNNKFIDWKTIL